MPNVEPNPGNAPHDIPPSQPAEVYGAAPERTTLAWQRTGLGVVVCSFLIFHTAFQLGVVVVGMVAAGLGLVAAALSVFTLPAPRNQHGRSRPGLPADSWGLLLRVALSVIGLGVLGAVTGVITLL